MDVGALHREERRKLSNKENWNPVMGPIEGPAPRRSCRQVVCRNMDWTCVIALQITDPSSSQRGRSTLTNLQVSKNN
jgi:hypothetical protein